MRTVLYIMKNVQRDNNVTITTGHGISVLVSDEHGDWKLLAHLCSSNGNMTLSCGLFFSNTELPVLLN